MSKNTIVYIGDFDLRNENVQAHLVKNNGKLLNELGYNVNYIGVNRECKSFEQIKRLCKYQVKNGAYLELPVTLSARGLIYEMQVESRIISYLNRLASKKNIKYIITYQSPTYAMVLRKIALWCARKRIPYIVNCADLPIFDSQPFIKRTVMKMNWHYMHYINKKYADGVVSVSHYIENYYKKNDRPSVIIPPLFDEPCSSLTKHTANNDATFLYAGTPFILSEHKIKTEGMKDRLDKVIDLMILLEKKNVEFCFNIVGIQLSEYCNCVPRHKKALESSERIVFHGRKTHEGTLEMLAASDYMINYRDKNLMTEAGLSTKVVESVSLGTPVVMNEIGDHFEYLEEGISGFKLTGDVEHDFRLLYGLCRLSKESRETNKKRTISQSAFSINKYTDSMSAFLGDVSAYRLTKEEGVFNE